MTSRPTTRDWLLFGLLSLFWGSSYLFIKIGIETLAPFTLIACRLFFGALVLAVALRYSKAPLPRERSTYGKLVVMAFFNIVLPFSLITWGERFIDPRTWRRSSRPRRRCSRSSSPRWPWPRRRSPSTGWSG